MKIEATPNLLPSSASMPTAALPMAAWENLHRWRKAKAVRHQRRRSSVSSSRIGCFFCSRNALGDQGDGQQNDQRA